MKRKNKTEALQEGLARRPLRQLSRFLQQRTRRLTRRQGLLLLALYALLSAGACLGVLLHSLRHPEAGPWQVKPIRAFPLPPAVHTLPESGDTAGRPLKDQKQYLEK